MWPKADSCNSHDLFRPAGMEFHPGKEGPAHENWKWLRTTYFFARWFSPVSMVGKSRPQVCSSLHGWHTAAPWVLSPALPVFLAGLFLFLPPTSSSASSSRCKWWDCFIPHFIVSFFGPFLHLGQYKPRNWETQNCFWVKRERIGDWAEIDEFPAVRGEK